MARKKRRTYSLEYKLETVALVLERGLSPRQVAKDLGIDRSTVGVWVRKAEAGELAAPGGGPKTEQQLTAENKKLRRENAILREEREILKKAAVHSTRQRNTSENASFGHWKPSTFRGRLLSFAAISSRRDWS